MPQRKLSKGLKVYESNIKDAVMRYLKQLPNCYAEKSWGGPRGRMGKPDISGCINGRRFEIELKTPGEELTPLQAHYLALWKGAGAVTGVARSVQDVKDILREAGLV